MFNVQCSMRRLNYLFSNNSNTIRMGEGKSMALGQLWLMALRTFFLFSVFKNIISSEF